MLGNSLVWKVGAAGVVFFLLVVAVIFNNEDERQAQQEREDRAEAQVLAQERANEAARSQQQAAQRARDAQTRLLAEIKADYDQVRPRTIRIRDCKEREFAGSLDMDGMAVVTDPDPYGGDLKVYGFKDYSRSSDWAPHHGVRDEPDGRILVPPYDVTPARDVLQIRALGFCLQRPRPARADGIYQITLEWRQAAPPNTGRGSRPAAARAQPTPPADPRPQCFGFASGCDERYGPGNWRP